MFRGWILACLLGCLLGIGAPTWAQAPVSPVEVRWAQAIDAAGKALENDDLAAAERQLAMALQAARALGDDSHELQLTHMLCVALYSAREEYRKAETHCTQVVAIAERRTGRASEDTANSLAMLTELYMAAEWPDKVEAPAQRALAIFRKQPKRYAEDIARMLMAITLAQITNQRWLEALTTIDQLETADLSGMRDETGLLLQGMKGSGLVMTGKVAEGAALARTTLATLRRQKGDDFEMTTRVLRAYASILMAQGKLANAEELVREAHDRSLVAPSEETVDFTLFQGEFHHIRMDIAAEEQALAKAQALATKLAKGKPVDDDMRDQLLDASCDLQQNRGNYREAERLTRELLQYEQAKSPNSCGLASTKMSLAEILMLQERYPDAIALLREAKPLIEKGYGAESLPALGSMELVGELALRMGDLAEAERFLEGAEALCGRILGADNVAALAEIRVDQAELRRRQGRLTEAQQLATEAVAGYEAYVGADWPATMAAVLVLADVNCDLNTPASRKEAEALYQRALTVREAKLNAEHPLIAETLEHYARYLRQVKRDKDAVACEERARAIRAKQ